MFHVRSFTKVLEAILDKIGRLKPEDQLRELDWLIGRLFILKVQIAEAKGKRPILDDHSPDEGKR
ncbi:MAG TPA: hypothetical protein VEM77_04535 [Thermoplasmata archaeon]|nr:hypothetical protein [Thermoplasmata archaeon]